MSNPGYLSPQDQEQLSAIQRKQAYARALLQQGGSDASGAYGGLRNAGSAILGAILSNRADKSEKTLTQGAASKYQQDLGSFLTGAYGQQPARATPQPQAAAPTPETQISNNPGSGPVLARPPIDPRDNDGGPPVAQGPPPAQMPAGGSQQALGSALQQPAGQAAPASPDPLAALVATHNPALMQQFAPALLQNQLTRQNKVWENSLPISQSAKDESALSLQNQEAQAKFTNTLPATAYQQAEIQNARATAGEAARHNKAEENIAQNPFGTGLGVPGAGNQTGDAFLQSLNPGLAAQIKAVGTYRQPAPAGRTSPTGIKFMTLVNQAYPDYDASQYGAKTKARNDFTTGKNGNTVRSLNVAVQHLDMLGQLSDALGNGDVRAANQIGNAFNTQFGASPATNFNAAKQIVGDEIVKAIVGAGGGVGDRDKAAESISAASSPQQLKGVIQTYQGLMSGQLGGLKQQYEKTTGLHDFEDYLAPETQQKLQAHTQQQSGSAAAATPKVIRYDAQGNRVP